MKSSELNLWHSMPAPPQHMRHRCSQCKRPLAVELQTEKYNAELSDVITHIQKTGKKMKRGKVLRWRYKSQGHFCTYRCGTIFANKTVDNLNSRY
jgi:hypothetical protein